MKIRLGQSGMTALLGLTMLQGASSAFAVEAPTAEAPPGAPLSLRDLRLSPAYEPRFENESAYQSAIAESCARLVEKARQVQDDAAQAETALQAANAILSLRCEPAATLMLLDMASADELRPLRELCEQAVAMIEIAEQAFERLAQRDENQRPEGLGQWRGDARYVKTAALLMHALAGGDASPDADESLSRIISQIALFLEDPRPGVAASCQLWQSVGLAKDGQHERALQILDVAAKAVRPAAANYDFFARLERCRILANRDSHLLALALLAKMEADCESWFHAEPAQSEALAAVRLARVQIAEAWMRAAPPESEGASRVAWRRDLIERLRAATFANPPANVTRLGCTIPLLYAPTDDDLLLWRQETSERAFGDKTPLDENPERAPDDDQE